MQKVPAKSDCVMCFGPVVEDGYGVCYNPKDKHINLVVSSFSTCQETDTGRMVQGVEAALLDMRTLLESTPKAKL
jgi:carnitine O-acetyltransferase